EGYRRSRRWRTIDELSWQQPYTTGGLDNRATRSVSRVRARGACSGLGVASLIKVDEARLQAVSDRQQRRIAHPEFAQAQRHRRLGIRARLASRKGIGLALEEKSTTDEGRRSHPLVRESYVA